MAKLYASLIHHVALDPYRGEGKTIGYESAEIEKSTDKEALNAIERWYEERRKSCSTNRCECSLFITGGILNPMDEMWTNMVKVS